MGADNVLQFASPVLMGELVCGHVDEQGVLHRSFQVHSMTGAEEDLLMAQGKAHEKMDALIWRCLDSVGDLSDVQTLRRVVRTLTVSDRLLLLLKIREVSLGSEFRMQIRCPSCGSDGRVSVDLSSLEVTPMPEPLQRVRTDEVSGYPVTWHIMTGVDEAWVAAHRKKLSQDMASLPLLARMESVGGEKLDRESPQGLRKALSVLRGMPVSMRRSLRALFAKQEGAVDTEVEYTCPSCGEEIRGDLEVGQPGFFFPQET